VSIAAVTSGAQGKFTIDVTWDNISGVDVGAVGTACPSRKSYPRVAMMQSGQDWYGDDGPRSLDRSSQRRVLAQPQVRARLIVIERIQSQEPSQMPFAIDQDVVQALDRRHDCNHAAIMF
jgi:hypothetical protein